MMSIRAATLVITLLGVTVSTAEAQERAPQATGEPDSLNVERLPLNVERIQRELRQAITVSEERDGLNLRYDVQVYGQAPQIELFTPEDNLLTGPVPYGAPTHREIVDHITPQEFRSPVMDFNALFKWLAERVGN